jgi:DNA-binding NtrC family response regulator
LLKVLETVGRVARTRAPVLILGESGTGKELIADALHRNSPRAAKPAVKINMGAITSSLFESEMFGHVKGAFTDARTDRRGHVAHAQGSTLFMDEIGELNRSDQVKLLRVLQDQSYRPVGASASEQADFRVVSATNRELAELVASGDFREDLYYRLNLITLRLPPLRERRSDIPLIATTLIAQLAADYGLGEAALTPAALDWLSAQPWPGNIRQLRQVLERTLLLAGKPLLDATDFRDTDKLRPETVGAAFSRDSSHLTLEQAERQMIEQVLAQHEGNISRVAKALGLSRAALYRRLEKHGLATGPDDAA